MNRKRKSWELTPFEASVKQRRPCHECGVFPAKKPGGEETFKDQIILCPLHRSASTMLSTLVTLAKLRAQPTFVYIAIAEAEGRKWEP